MIILYLIIPSPLINWPATPRRSVPLFCVCYIFISAGALNLFSRLHSIAVLVYFAIQIVPDAACAPASFWPVPIILDTSLLSDTTVCLRFIRCFSCPSLKLALSLGDLLPFSGGWYLEIKIWVLSVFIVTGVSLLLDPFRGES